MSSNFYLPRKLYNHDRDYNELEVLSTFKIIIILAEPGAGKTSLLDNFARFLDTTKKSANTFLYGRSPKEKSPLIIDALDELVRVDQSAIHQLLGKVTQLEPSTLVISSRSSEWEDSYTKQVKEFLECEPNIFRLYPFTEIEQQQIFENYKQYESFDEFKFQVTKFNLDPLLPNPQFLKLLADAYIESNRIFQDRKSIFAQAIKGLAEETNLNYNFRNDLNSKAKVNLTEEVFAKILLSGAEGISTNNNSSDRLYPRIDSLLNLESTEQ